MEIADMNSCANGKKFTTPENVAIVYQKRSSMNQVPAEEINAMRSAIAAEQERQINQKGNSFLQTLIGQSMLDWSRSPLENNGRNREVATAIQARSAGMLGTAWVNSPQSLALHSSLIRNGKNEVFAESPEMEAFSLLIGSSLALYIPGYCEFYPQSKYSKAGTEILVGICNGNHYYLAVPKEWIVDQPAHTLGIKKGSPLFLLPYVHALTSQSIFL